MSAKRRDLRDEKRSNRVWRHKRRTPVYVRFQ